MFFYFFLFFGRLCIGHYISSAVLPIPHVCCQTAHSHDAELSGNPGNLLLSFSQRLLLVSFISFNSYKTAQIVTEGWTCTYEIYCIIPSILLRHWHITGILLEMCTEVCTSHWMSSVAQLAGHFALTTEPCPNQYPCQLKTQAVTKSVSGPVLAISTMCASVCAWVSAGLVIFHWSPIALVDKHESPLKRTVVGGSAALWPPVEPLNLKAFRWKIPSCYSPLLVLYWL